ncbi:MAG: enoyl-CoA hydratase, partial [Acidimicrobiales bacterium]|nr:enoyl-CoA hydratase [Acidimicrobiales bacterium]
QMSPATNSENAEPHGRPSRVTPPIILLDVVDRIGVITLNRPSRRNALNGELIEALDQAVREVAVRDDIKVVILTGAAGDGAHGGFCSGGDTKDGGVIPGRESSPGVPRDALNGDLSRHDTHAAMLLHMMPKPTIAMVGGPAVGAGCSLAAACDLRFASDDAVFASNFSSNGLSGDYGGSFFWSRIIGTARTRELYFLNDKIRADQAYEWGMVNSVVPAAELRDYTLAAATRMLRTPASLFALMKDNLNQAEDEIERRRYLFGLEASNQGKAGADIAARMLRQSRPPAPPPAAS